MTSREGKIDNVERIVLRLESDFKSLEEKQLSILQRHIETSAATVIAAYKKDLEEIHKSLLIIADAIKACDCNKEIIKTLNDKIGTLPTTVPLSPSQATQPSSIGMARDDRSLTGLSPAVVNKFVYTPRLL
jgi:hypothetical protein